MLVVVVPEEVTEVLVEVDLVTVVVAVVSVKDSEVLVAEGVVTVLVMVILVGVAEVWVAERVLTVALLVVDSSMAFTGLLSASGMKDTTPTGISISLTTGRTERAVAPAGSLYPLSVTLYLSASQHDAALAPGCVALRETTGPPSTHSVSSTKYTLYCVWFSNIVPPR